MMEEAYEWLEWKGHHHLVASVTPGEVSAIVGMGTRGVPSRPKEEVGHVDWDRRIGISSASAAVRMCTRLPVMRGCDG